MTTRRAVSKSQPSTNGDSVRKLARIANRQQNHRELCGRIEWALNSLRKGGLHVVVGEVQLLTELQRTWEETGRGIQQLDDGSDQKSLDNLEKLVDDVIWEVAEDVAADLDQKLDQQRQKVREYTDRVAEWRAKIDELGKQLNKARKLRAGVLKQDSRFNHLDAKVREADRELKDLNYAKAQRCLEELKQKTADSESLLKELKQKEDEGQKYSAEAELLVLRSPDDPGLRRVHYTVLLRTPSEPGTHGINIEATSTLSEQDRRAMKDELAKVTKAINLGLARSAALAGTGTGGSTAAVGVIVGTGSVGPGSIGPVSVGTGPGGTGTGLADAELRNLIVTGTGTGVSGPPIQLNELMRDVGDLMYRLIIPEQMQSLLAGSPCSLTVTTNDLELPWELMHLGKEFLCVELPVARMPMGRTIPRRPKPPQPRSKLRFLLVHADPEDNLPLARQEVEMIKEALDRDWKDRIEVKVLMRTESSGRELNEALRRGGYDVIHYAGHAGFDDKDGDLSGLLLHDKEIFFAQKIRRILEGRPLVFLNACEAGFVANAKDVPQISRYLQEPAEGLASAFIYGGAVGCIGALWPIYDGPAAEFAISFYGYVLEGYTLGEAMRRARGDIRTKHPEQITWASFVLYGDPRFNLVD